MWVAVNCAKLGANVTIVARNPKWLGMMTYKLFVNFDVRLTRHAIILP